MHIFFTCYIFLNLFFIVVYDFSFFCIELILRTKREHRCADIDWCSSFATRVADSFGDNEIIEAIFIHFFSLCLLADEKEVRPAAGGYRVFLPATLSVCAPFSHYYFSLFQSFFWLSSMVQYSVLLVVSNIHFLHVFHTIQDTVLYEKYKTGSPYNHDVALSFFEERYKVDDLLDAKLVSRKTKLFFSFLCQLYNFFKPRNTDGCLFIFHYRSFSL